MISLESILLVFHIASGTIALCSGFIAIISAKGNRAHIFSGSFFFWNITIVFITASCLAFPRENWFLFLIAVFSFQLAAIGFRIYKLQKRNAFGLKPLVIDWLIGIIPTVFNVLVFIWGIYYVNNGQYFALTGILFGSIGLAYAFSWLRFLKRPPKEKSPWILFHLQSMGAAYIAVCTAFLVVNFTFLPPLILWLVPAVAGGTCITIASVKIKRRISYMAETSIKNN